jgi:TetR/AcrR family transcriptional regulator, copper-responsive repressor
MYLAVTERFADEMRAEMAVIPTKGTSVRAGLGQFFDRVIAIYTSGETSRGCLVFCTAPSEAVSDPVIAARLERLLTELDGAMADLFTAALAAGELRPGSDPAAVGRLCAAIQHSLSLRARSGASVAQLQAFVAEALGLLPWTPES